MIPWQCCFGGMAQRIGRGKIDRSTHCVVFIVSGNNICLCVERWSPNSQCHDTGWMQIWPLEVYPIRLDLCSNLRQLSYFLTLNPCVLKAQNPRLLPGCIIQMASLDHGAFSGLLFCVVGHAMWFVMALTQREMTIPPSPPCSVPPSRTSKGHRGQVCNPRILDRETPSMGFQLTAGCRPTGLCVQSFITTTITKGFTEPH